MSSGDRSAPLASALRRRGGQQPLQLSTTGAFELFASRLEISNLQQATVSTRQQAVRASLERRLVVLDTFLTGSYRRHTMISPLAAADIDLFCVLDPAYFAPNGQAALLEWVRNVLRETYTRTPSISLNGQAVTIRFQDFAVDVVPAFYRRGGGFLIPSANEGRWIETDPKVHEAFMASANASHGGKLIPLIKMIKAWNRTSGGLLQSFYIELMVEAILRGLRIVNYPSAVTFVLSHAQEQVKFKMLDPASLDEGQVNGLTRGGVPQLVSTVASAYKVALEAERLRTGSQDSRAKTIWRRIFGDPFPAR